MRTDTPCHPVHTRPVAGNPGRGPRAWWRAARNLLICVCFVLPGMPAGLPSARAASAPGPTHPWRLPSQLAFAPVSHSETVAVTAMAQDSEGFIWFATQSNLLRWDGYRMRPYARNPDAPGSLPDNYIRCLLIDGAGRLWVGTNSAGLSRYDAQSDGFIEIPVGPGGTRDGVMMALVSDGHNGVWVGTGHGVDHVDGATMRVDTTAAQRSDDSITALLLDRTGTLWAGTRQGLLRRGPGEAAFTPFALPMPQGSSLVIRSLHEDRAGRLWIGLDLNGVYILEPGARSVHPLLESPNGKPLTESVTAMSDIDSSEVWLGTADGGIIRVDTRNWTLAREQRDPARGHSLPSNQIDSMFLDRDGTLWIGTRTALVRINPQQRLIDTYYGSPARGALLRGESVSSLLGMPDGRVWMGLVGGGLEIVDPASGAILTLAPRGGYSESDLPKTQVVTMARVNDGSVFLGTTAGLYRVSADARQVHRMHVPGHSDTFDVRALRAADGRLWVGGLEGLVELKLLDDGTVAPLREWRAELGDPRVRTLATSPHGLWIGTTSGVSYLDSRTGTITRLPNDPRNAEMLPGGYISSVLTDREGRLWVGTFGRGIEVEQRRDGQGRPLFRRLTQSDGLPENSIDAMVPDDEGNIWVSTDGGLARISPTDLAIRDFRAEQGVGVDGFFTTNADKTPAGDILFGGLNGLIVVHPKNLTRVGAAPQVVLTDLRVGGQTVAPSRGGAGIEIGAGDRSLAAQFAAADFTDAARRTYAYRLLGFENKWNETEAARPIAAYTNLPPGDYTLHLRSTAPDTGPTSLMLPVHVQPAWYEYRATRVLAALLALTLVALLMQVRMRMLRRRQRELELLVAERTFELKRHQESLEKMAYLDPLTGLPNRRAFNDELRRLIAAAQRGQGDIALLIVDLDGFKAINDSLGHDAGDAVLAEMAQRLRLLLRATDVVSRLGGDEFGVILVGPGDVNDVDALCGRIIERLSQPIRLGEKSVAASASIGIASTEGSKPTPEDLCKAADVALYEAKRAGRRTWRWGTQARPTPEAADALLERHSTASGT